ncbi:beta-galactosidase [Sphingopyxis sp. MWB1]|uniref:beta-galactosidase n=1 Tax=Sphingopyxis sp. MWB1 TaxID=1537715 RepID=UPI00051A60C5|nr:beta-galactosidase [Sphingopyxis sp. MWB1]
MRLLRSSACLAAILAASSPVVSAQEAAAPPNVDAPMQQFGRVAFDGRSLFIDGRRTIIWGSEMHYFRLPSPDLWRDILQKMKASGFNTVALYFYWGYHSPSPGTYDFSGIRDVDRLLTMAREEGLYVITRAGPYVNAELTRGGYPGWLVNQRARARTDNPEYEAAGDEWLSRINAIIARHQINGDGKGNSGSVILHQIENELALTTPKQRRYMDHLYAKARADGITVPIFHNDQGRNGYWVPENSPIAETVAGPTDLYAWDSYPGGTCTVAGEVTRGSPAPDFGYYGPGGARGGSSASPNTPGFAAEFGGGWFDYWGSNGGYECNAIQRGRRYQRVFYGTNLANGIGIQSFYMGYGGTSWGWLPAPVVFTSYDYGAAISEARTIRDKAKELKQLGGLIEAVPDLAGMVPAGKPATSTDKIRLYHNRLPETDARFLLVTQNPSNGRDDLRFHFTLDLPGGAYRIPSQGEMELNGFDAKWLIANTAIGGQKLVYSTSELQTALKVDGDDILLFYGRKGEAGETVLHYSSEPRVQVLEGEVTHRWDAARGNLVLRYPHSGLARVAIESSDRPRAELLIADEETGWQFSKQATAAGDILVRGPELVRRAIVRKASLALEGDTDSASPFEIWLPGAVRNVTWNDRPVALKNGSGGSRVASHPLPGPQPITLPPLQDWRRMKGSPESAANFDDSAWQTAEGKRYSSTTARPDGQPNLLMDPYGFHEGDVWYRGRFEGSPEAGRIRLYYGAGGSGMIQVYVDGKLVGQDELPGGLPRPITTGVAQFDLPDAARTPGQHVIAVLLRNNGHNWNLEADDFHKEARGLVSVSIEQPGGRSFAVPVDWKLHGRGEKLPDPVRGVPNNGGLHGEFAGWHLPGFEDKDWSRASLPDQSVEPGVTWYRTHFALDLPQDQDATIGVAFGDVDQPRSPVAYRATLFVNGWNMGQFIAHVGPQRIFPIPRGILNHNGRNVIALAVISDGAAGNALEAVRLVTLHNRRSGIDVRNVEAPRKPEELIR